MKLRTLLIFAFLAAVIPFGAAAQVCTPACHSDETLNADGTCEHDGGFPSFPRSHRFNDCAATAPVNHATGICTPAGGCGGGGGAGGLCREHPVCAAGEVFRDGGCYPPCSPPGACSHTRAICEEGWTLDTARGVCRLCRIPPVGGGGHPPVFLRPDLVFSATPVIQPALPGNSVRRGQRYAICFKVRNIGGLAAGAFRVEGGGLGIPTLPHADFPGLAAGAVVGGCLIYPTTPAVGHYTVGLTVDAGFAVTELHEDNNTANVTVNVVP